MKTGDSHVHKYSSIVIIEENSVDLSRKQVLHLNCAIFIDY